VMDRNYINIFELSSEFQDEDRKAVDDGILTVMAEYFIDCGDSEPKEYYLNKTNPDE